jgi:Leucine-rich repeat (LRR) protein
MKTNLKFLLILPVFLVLTQCKKQTSDPIAIPDNNFKKFLIKAGIDTDGDGNISSAEASAVKTLRIVNGFISDLTGIESFVNLDTLTCDGNMITSLDVSMNKNLVFLSCEQNKLSALDISKNQALSTLYCSQNEITSVDISNNFLMWRFKCDHNKLTNLDVTKNPGLQTLSCGANLLTSLDISHNAALKNSYPLTSLFINDMPTLNKVCVWETTFPPVDMSIDATGSPNVIFSTDCSN